MSGESLPQRQPLASLEQAWSQLREAVQLHVQAHPRPSESIDSLQALDRVLAHDLVSGCDVPPLDNSAMDGYALRAEDARTSGARLLCSQRVAAGDLGTQVLPGHCARIFTGAAIPPGATAVIAQEWVEADEGQHVRLSRAVQAGDHIRRAAEDIGRGQVVLRAGRRLGATALGVAASVGQARLEVVCRPKVALLTTGNELSMPGQSLPAGGIYNSNRHALHALVQACGGDCQDLGIVPDALEATRLALLRAAQDCELIISSGGVSVGEADHVRQALASAGGLQLWSLAIKPGKPFAFGWVNRPQGGRSLYLGLPGNPAASSITFLLLARPVLSCLAGQDWALPQAVSAQAGFEWPRPDLKRREFLRARRDDNGQLVLHANQGSAVLTSLAWADGLVDLPAECVVQNQDWVSWLPWSELMQPAALSRQP